MAWRFYLFARRPLFLLGYPEAALADAERALSDARSIGHVTTLLFALSYCWWTNFVCGNYATANALADELSALADEKISLHWKAFALRIGGCFFVETGRTGCGSTAPFWNYRMAVPRVDIGDAFALSYLATAYADNGEYDHAWRYVGEALAAIRTTQDQFRNRG